jgi:hypothetical protein
MRPTRRRRSAASSRICEREENWQSRRSTRVGCERGLPSGIGIRYEFERSDGSRVGVVHPPLGDPRIVMFERDDPDTSHDLLGSLLRTAGSRGAARRLAGGEGAHRARTARRGSCRRPPPGRGSLTVRRPHDRRHRGANPNRCLDRGRHASRNGPTGSRSGGCTPRRVGSPPRRSPGGSRLAADIGSRARIRAAVGSIARGEFSIVIAGIALASGAEPDLGPLAAVFVLLAIAGPVVARVVDRRVTVGPERRRSGAGDPALGLTRPEAARAGPPPALPRRGSARGRPTSG